MTDQPYEPPAPPPADELPAIVEALLFVADEPATPAALARVLGVGEAAVRRALDDLAASSQNRGLRIQQLDGRYNLITAPEHARYIEEFIGASRPRLSRAALETLSIIAYRQPCTRAEIESIRGANSDRLVVTLEQRGLIESTGNADGPGRPKLYAVTREFYDFFGLTGPGDLPPLPGPVEVEQSEVAV